MRKRTIAAGRALAAVFLALAVAACAQVLPETAALEAVHEAYQRDFERLFLSRAADTPKCLADMEAVGNGEGLFTRTEAEIRRFRSQFPDRDVELAHLDVLEAMIRLQVGEWGKARLLADNVRAAAGKLRSGTGSHVRDGMFAENFASLVEGWRNVCELARGAPVPDAARSLRGASHDIGAWLDEARRDNRLAALEADDGAIYLGNTAAIFTVWEYSERRRQCLDEQQCACPTGSASCTAGDEAALAGALQVCANAACRRAARTRFVEDGLKPGLFSRARDRIGPFLTPLERKQAQCDAEPVKSTSPRRRYLAWYQYLNNESGSLRDASFCTP